MNILQKIFVKRRIEKYIRNLEEEILSVLTSTPENYINKLIERLRYTYAKGNPSQEDEVIRCFEKLNNFKELYKIFGIVWIVEIIWDNLIQDVHPVIRRFAPEDQRLNSRFEFVSTLIARPEFKDKFEHDFRFHPAV